ncbi:restriction endonuclease subunit S [Corynebacterium renale]|uniref:restriction endonuclease subunit S n=1 Tax=Corynebacterium renale TaxID=1724 RepID=UPI000E07B53D|nr:restriction endonuclease subunit S [Corynebacterium renale]STD03997.1 Restriction enzyme BgcI subunit beta [Corynebacterium renale]
MKRLDEIFDLRYGHSLELNALKKVEAPSGVNFVSRAMGNNGVTARVAVDAIPAQAGEISVALGGNGVLSSFVQPEPFVCGRDVMILRPQKAEMSLTERLWYCRCIWENRHRYSYGRQANRTLGSLLVPDEMPNWAKSMVVPDQTKLASSIEEPISLPTYDNWAEFPLSDLFNFRRGKPINKADRTPGSTPYVGASASNNGVTDHIDAPANFPGGILTVAYDGSVGETFYQEEPVYVGEKVQGLIPKAALNKWSLLFIATIIRFEKWRFNYGYKWNLKRMKRTTIRLPIDSAGAPHWGLIERYMKGLHFSAALAESEG